MKKLFVVLLTLLALSCPAFAADWYYLGNSKDGTQYYIDNSSVEKNEKAAMVWCKTIDTDGSSSIVQYAFIRNEKLIAILNISNYDANDSYISGYSYALQWGAIVPDTVGELIYYSIWPY